LLYIVGADPAELPDMPMSLDYATHVIGGFSRVGEPGRRPEITKAEREHTPPPWPGGWSRSRAVAPRADRFKRHRRR
jgi:hypothetical protein